MAKGQNHQIVKTPRDCPGVKHQNFEKKISLHCFLYPSTTFKKLKPKIQNKVVFLKRPNIYIYIYIYIFLYMKITRNVYFDGGRVFEMVPLTYKKSKIYYMKGTHLFV